MASIKSSIRNLFLKHGVYKELGISLLHKHFTIKPTERLVDFRNISAPWTIGDDDANDAIITHKHDGLILPRSFRLVDEGKLVPYEFDFSDTDWIPRFNPAFISELSDLLCASGLDQILGLRILDKRESELPVEITKGKMNIMIPRGVIPESELIEALWVFGLGDDDDDRCHHRSVCRRLKNGDHYESDHSYG